MIMNLKALLGYLVISTENKQFARKLQQQALVSFPLSKSFEITQTPPVRSHS
ncbi:hypothetical protein VCHA28O22_20011 [Vibrio chagasii]|nr:hypothetical protein VCHA34P121_10012 [Vibrio chagasii]CAH6859567.1 hypothetical protein VCHA29O37_200011 [Vibrio chagasii]CAH6878798.1 hypothetical protein VCHA28O22_20011 [Vibrio chagasii]CAH6994591.1 hypothetical protein VCHA32O87_50024 [Vibrio chagasii]CAH7255078.1 hypothetical protein VCHA53O474_20005 [Vibrio chagasii]